MCRQLVTEALDVALVLSREIPKPVSRAVPRYYSLLSHTSRSFIPVKELKQPLVSPRLPWRLFFRNIPEARIAPSPAHRECQRSPALFG